jgi:hypothetical protein
MAKLCLEALYKKLVNIPGLKLEKKLAWPKTLFGQDVSEDYDQIIFFYEGKRIGDAICSETSYGYPDSLEIMGSCFDGKHWRK